MSITILRQQIHRRVDDLPSSLLTDVADYLDFLHYKLKRPTAPSQVQEAIRRYVAGEVSLGRAAEMAGINYFLFEELLREEGIPTLAARVTDKETRAAQQEIADEILA